MERAALYIRVSTEEQAIHGYSLEAQRENLTTYAKENNMFIVDYYVDEGASARKKYTTRKEFMRMLSDIQAGLIDIILFIKMDRWFRSVADYYKVQEILDKHKVNWKATLEDYDTTTSSGRLNLNIRLSIAQNESEMTSERIKFVFESMRQRGELTNASCPIGYKIKDKHLVIDPETAPIVQDIFQRCLSGNTLYSIMKHYRENCGINFARSTFYSLLRNPVYKGELHHNKGKVEPLISEVDFQKVQELLARNAKKAPSGVKYIFSGLILCQDCKHRMSGSYRNSRNGSKTIYYRCSLFCDRHSCTHNKVVRQDYIEKQLLDTLRPKMEQFIFDIKVKQKAPQKKQIDVDKIRQQIERVQTLYINGLTNLETCKKDCAKLEKQLQEAEQQPASQKRNIEKLSKLLESNFEETYTTLSDEEKQQFWRSFLSSIYVDSDNNISIFFD